MTREIRTPYGQVLEGWEARVKKYRKRPLVVEAFRPIEQYMIVSTPQGPTPAWPGDYIITRGSSNEMYPVRPWVFEFVYEPASEDDEVDMSTSSPHERR